MIWGDAQLPMVHRTMHCPNHTQGGSAPAVTPMHEKKSSSADQKPQNLMRKNILKSTSGPGLVCLSPSIVNAVETQDSHRESENV